MTTPAKVISIAREYGVSHYKEGKNNDSIFGKWYGMNYAPWCAMFVSYCFNKAGAGSLVAAQTAKGFASCSAAVKWFKAKKSLVNVAKAQPGDVVFMNFTGGKSADHVGICMSIDKKSKVLHCVEGNTVNPDGTGDQVNGDGVYFKTRPFRYIVAVARPNWAALDGIPAAPKPPVATPTTPAAPKPAPAAPKPAAKPTTYKVKAGDSYWSIAEKNGLDFKALQKINGDKALHPGDVIKLK